MPYTFQIIDGLLAYFEEVRSSDYAVSNIRARILSRLQATSDYVWGYANWPWKERTQDLAPGVVEIVAGYQGFKGFGRNGLVLISEDSGVSWRELEWKPHQEVQRIRNANAPTSPSVYALVYGIGSSFLYGDGCTSVPQILIGPAPDNSTFILRLVYDGNCPRLDDNTAEPGTGEPGKLDYVCDAQYHYSVIEAGAMYHLMRDKGDGRWLQQREIWMDALRQMAANEVADKHTLHRMPRFGRR